MSNMINRDNEPNFPKVSGRMYKIKCVGDSNSVAKMLEDIAKRIRAGAIHFNYDMFYNVDSIGYCEERYRTESHDRDMKKMK